MDYTPDACILRAYAAANHSWKIVLGELIDNALDAGAMSITVSFDQRKSRSHMTVVDDGHGTQHISNIVLLGGRQSHSGTKLGRFGIGAKEAILWIGGIRSKVMVRSTHGDKTRALEVIWEEMQTRKWQGDDPVESPAEPGAKGTRITIAPCRKVPQGAAWTSLRDEIGYLYSPALKRGALIRFDSGVKNADPAPLQRWELPPMLPDAIDTRIEVAGKGVRVHCGIVSDAAVKQAAESGRPLRRGITYSHGFRVIIPATASGCGGYNIARVCGIAVLDDAWALTKNKDGIDAHEDELYAAVEDAIRPILEKAADMSSRLESAAFTSKVEGALNAMLSTEADAKAKRGEGEQRGTKKPTGNGGKHKRAENEQRGRTFHGSGGSGGHALHISWEAMGHHGAGEVKGNTVVLNSDNSFVEEARRTQNTMATVAVVAGMLSNDECSLDAGGQRRLRMKIDATADVSKNYSLALGAILRAPTSVDGAMVAGARG